MHENDKLIDQLGQYRYTIVPGIFLGKESAKEYGFVQVLDEESGHVIYRT
jgi:hypothetical protein